MNKNQQKDHIRLKLAESQNWICPISKVKFILINNRVIDPTTNKAVSVDHCHKTGLIRGVLIQKVNWLIDQWDLGSYGDLPRPQEITNYLNNYPARDSIGDIQYSQYWK